MPATTGQEPWTIKRLLDWTTEFFQSKQLDSPRLCAEILLAEALDCQRIELYTRFDQVPEEPALGTYRDWVKRHAKGEPVAYLVGHKEFYSLKFAVNSHVLIPRPETEHLVLAAIESAHSLNKDNVTIVDIGTGSGCVAITLAKHITNATLLATDISNDALSIAQQNAAAHQLDHRIQFVVSDLFDDISRDIQPDIVVSNPPYIGTSESGTVDRSVRDFEPAIALFAGEDGTSVIEPLVRQAAEHLLPGGFLIFETSPIIMDRCLEFVASHPKFEGSKVSKDLAGHQRIVRARISND